VGTIKTYIGTYWEINLIYLYVLLYVQHQLKNEDKTKSKRQNTRIIAALLHFHGVVGEVKPNNLNNSMSYKFYRCWLHAFSSYRGSRKMSNKRSLRQRQSIQNERQQAQHPNRHRRKTNCSAFRHLLLVCSLLFTTVTISNAKGTHEIQRQLRHRKGDPPDAPSDDYGEYSDDSVEGNTHESSYGGYSSLNSAYGDYGAYTPKGSSGSETLKTSSSSYSSSGYGLDSYDNHGSSSTTSESYEWGAASSSTFKPSFNMPQLQLSLIPAIFLILFVTVTGMLITAYQMEHAPEGTFANCCRVSLTTVSCIYKVVYNLYHCRLGEIPQVVFASEFDDDELTDEELERMKLRPGIERALDVEHRKALRKVGIEMNKIKVNDGAKHDGTGNVEGHAGGLNGRGTAPC
jgi:hypothetical protein